MANPLRDNRDRSRFELEVNSEIVFADYRREGSTMHILHVEAPPSLRGTGAAGQLMQEILDMSRKENLTLVPVCGYAAAWLKRHA